MSKERAPSNPSRNCQPELDGNGDDSSDQYLHAAHRLAPHAAIG